MCVYLLYCLLFKQTNILIIVSNHVKLYYIQVRANIINLINSLILFYTRNNYNNKQTPYIININIYINNKITTKYK